MTFVRLFQAWAALTAAIEVRAKALLEETDIRTAVELLPEWADLLRISEDCSIGPPDTVPEIRFASYIKLTLPGGQNAFHMAEVAQLLGYQVEVEDFEELEPFVAGSDCGDPLYSDAWRFVVVVHAPVATPRFARTGLSVCGERLCSFGNELLSCSLDRIKPAHVVFLYEFDQPYVGYAPWNVILPDAVTIDVQIPAPKRL